MDEHCYNHWSSVYPTLPDTTSWLSAIPIQCHWAFLTDCFHIPYGTLMFLFNNSLQPWRKTRSMILMHLYSLESIAKISVTSQALLRNIYGCKKRLKQKKWLKICVLQTTAASRIIFLPYTCRKVRISGYCFTVKV